MTEIIGVRFRRSAKVYYFAPGDLMFRRDEPVIVETVRGVELGRVSIENLDLPEEMIPKELRNVIRKADDSDVQKEEENQKMAKEAFDVCREKIAEHKLKMSLSEAEYTFDNNKLIFYFTSDGRVDFRNLVRDLAQVFRTRIELRQIGERDQAKMIGGIGSCGQVICCHRFLDDFSPVSIRMAKTQGLSLNPAKISGLCGRLMCCLNYEQEVYKENSKQVPDYGTLVMTEEGQGYVVDRDVLQKRVRIHIYKDDQTEDQGTFDVDDIEVLEVRKKGQRRPPLRTDLKGGEYSAEKAEEMRQKKQERLERKPRIQQKKNLLAQEDWEQIFDDDDADDTSDTNAQSQPQAKDQDDSKKSNSRSSRRRKNRRKSKENAPQKGQAQSEHGNGNGQAPKKNCANCAKHDDPIDSAVVVADSKELEQKKEHAGKSQPKRDHRPNKKRDNHPETKHDTQRTSSREKKQNGNRDKKRETKAAQTNAAHANTAQTKTEHAKAAQPNAAHTNTAQAKPEHANASHKKEATAEKKSVEKSDDAQEVKRSPLRNDLVKSKHRRRGGRRR